MNPSNSCANDSPRESLYASATSEQLLLDLDPGGREGEGEGEQEKGKGRGETGGMGRGGEDHGLAVVELSTLHFYLVSGYHGDQKHDYVCAYVSVSSTCTHDKGKQGNETHSEQSMIKTEPSWVEFKPMTLCVLGRCAYQLSYQGNSVG